MIWLLLPIAYCILPTAPVHSQTNDHVLQYARSVVDTLTAPGMHGRGYVSKGDSIASAYIADQFKAFGLKSFSKNYFQTFKLSINSFPGVVKLKADDEILVAGKDFILNGDCASTNGTYPVLWTTQDSLHLLKKTKGKIIVIDNKETTTRPITKSVKNIKKSAGMIQLSDKLTAGLSSKQADRFFASMLRTENKFNQITITVDAKQLKDYQTRNIIGFIPGQLQPDSFIVFSAHYDHLGRMGRDTYFPGANDNASGIAMLLSLAKYYSQNPPAYSIVFLAFAAEEAGLIGSLHYVQNPLFPLNRIKFLINMDIMGTGDEGIKVVNGAVLKEPFELLVKLNDENKLLASVQPRGKAANSDHYFFTEAGVDAFFIYTLGGIKAYHDIYDRAETLPLTDFTDIYNLLIKFSSELQK